MTREFQSDFSVVMVVAVVVALAALAHCQAAPDTEVVTCDFKTCIRDGETFSTSWGGATPHICYTRSGDSLIPDPCPTTKHRHLEPSPVAPSLNAEVSPLVPDAPVNTLGLPDAPSTSAGADGPSTVCAALVNCDDGVTDYAGNFHKYGDMLTECLDPKISAVVVLSPGPCAEGSKPVGDPDPVATAPIASSTPSTPFFKFGRWNADQPLRTTREVLTSKLFIAVHAAELAATVWDVEMTHAGIAHRKCAEANRDLPSHPSRGEMYRYNLIPLAVTGVFDFIMDRFVWRPLSLIGPARAITIHAQGAISWAGDCW